MRAIGYFRETKDRSLAGQSEAFLAFCKKNGIGNSLELHAYFNRRVQERGLAYRAIARPRFAVSGPVIASVRRSPSSTPRAIRFEYLKSNSLK